MGRSTPFETPSATVRHYLVGRDGEGHWVVRDEAGLTGGLFVSRSAAVRYATFETDHRPDAVRFVPEPMTLSLSGQVQRL